MKSNFEWDEAKNAANIAKHGIDFDDAIRLFASFTEVRSPYPHEVRWLATGWLDDGWLTVVYAWRGGKRRIISARRARRIERYGNR